jgi:preprotein translocase subunit SecD
VAGLARSLAFASALLLCLAGAASAAPLVITLAEARATTDIVTGEPVLSFTMTPESAKAFAELTAANVGKVVELRIDGVTLSAPIVREPIVNGVGQISGQMTSAEAEEWARRLTAGSAVIEVEAMP